MIIILNKNVKKILLGVFIVFFSIACSKTESKTIQEINNNIKISDVKLNMSKEAAFKILGSDYKEENCILGKEYDYSNKINIVVASDNLVLRLITYNKDSEVYGIKIGSNYQLLVDILLKNGYKSENNSKYNYVKDDVRVTIQSFKGEIIDGYVLDVIK